MVTATVATPRSARSASQLPSRDFLSEIKTSGQKLPNRVILHGVEGVGKTSFGAAAPKPIFLMAHGETGLETLIDNARLPDVPHLPETHAWEDALGAIRALRDGEHDFKTLVIDTLNGVERLCHEYVCRRDFNNDWSERGFTGYMRGPEVALADWRELLGLLDDLRTNKRMAILCLAHTKVATFKNPEGADFDRYTVDMHHKTWGLTHKWADMVLFANFFIDTTKEGGRAKGVGGQDRLLFTERRASYDAKNRHGLPPEIEMGRSYTEAWANFIAALKTAKGEN